MIRVIVALLGLSVMPPALAAGQSPEIFGSAGPTLTDAGHSYAVGAGFSPHPRMTLVFTFDRTHLESRTTGYPNGDSSFRGGTFSLAAAELRVLPFGRDRVGPYGLAGLAMGRSQPTVNATFPDRVVNHVAAMFFGGGLQMPVGERFSIFGDGRLVFGAEGGEGIVAAAPIRAGVSWRF